MAKSKKSSNQSGGVNISGSTVNVQGDIVGRDKVTKNISGAPASAKKDSQNQSNKPIKILFLAARPTDMARLRLDEEIHGIEQALRQVEYRDRFELKQAWAVRVTDLQAHLLRHQPDIVHFSGHGSEASEIILEDDDGNSQEVPARALSKLFEIFKENVRCVVLNACYSKRQAQAIAEHIDGVIGMSKAVGDEAAINFAMAFYQALGYGRNLQTAFELGCNQINLQNLNEENTPKLIMKRKDPQEIVFAKNDQPNDPAMGSASEKSGALVGKIEAEKVVVATKIDTLNM